MQRWWDCGWDTEGQLLPVWAESSVNVFLRQRGVWNRALRGMRFGPKGQRAWARGGSSGVRFAAAHDADQNRDREVTTPLPKPLALWPQAVPPRSDQ
jgi:hypothetical protein